jgi:hypothetical protein
MNLITGLVGSVLKRESLEAYLQGDLDGNSSMTWWMMISCDKTWRTEKLVPRRAGGGAAEDADTAVYVCLWGPPSVRHVSITVHERDRGAVNIYVPRNQKTTITVRAAAGDDIHGVALVQALPSEGLSQILHDAGKHIAIEVNFHRRPTKVAFESLVAPLLPLIAVPGRKFTNQKLVGVLL